MRVQKTSYSLRRYSVSGKEWEAISPRTGEKLYKVSAIELEYKKYEAGHEIVTTHFWCRKYRRGKLRANAAKANVQGLEIYLTDDMRAILDEIGDKDLSSAYWLQLSKEYT